MAAPVLRKRPAAAKAHPPALFPSDPAALDLAAQPPLVGPGAPLLGNSADPLGQELAGLHAQLQEEATTEAAQAQVPDPPPRPSIRRSEDPNRVGESAASSARLLRQRLANLRFLHRQQQEQFDRHGLDPDRGATGVLPNDPLPPNFVSFALPVSAVFRWLLFYRCSSLPSRLSLACFTSVGSLPLAVCILLSVVGLCPTLW